MPCRCSERRTVVLTARGTMRRPAVPNGSDGAGRKTTWSPSRLVRGCDGFDSEGGGSASSEMSSCSVAAETNASYAGRTRDGCGLGLMSSCSSCEISIADGKLLAERLAGLTNAEGVGVDAVVALGDAGSPVG